MQGISSDSKNGDDSDPPGGSSKTPVEDSIRAKITAQLQPEELEIINESDRHAGHSGNPNNDPETHFKLRIVSSKFEGMNAIKRHRTVFGIIKEELDGPVHACSLETKTPDEC